MNSHPLAGTFRLMTSEELKALEEDIKQHGQIEPIVTYNGEILDGRNRFKICEKLGIEPKFAEFKENGQSALDFVLSKNLHRRHLTVTEKAFALLPIYDERCAQAVHTRIRGKTRSTTKESMAKEFGISSKYIQIAKMITVKFPEKIPELISGKISLEKAYYQVRGPQAKKKVLLGRIRPNQRDFIDIGRPGEDENLKEESPAALIEGICSEGWYYQMEYSVKFGYKSEFFGLYGVRRSPTMNLITAYPVHMVSIEEARKEINQASMRA